MSRKKHLMHRKRSQSRTTTRTTTSTIRCRTAHSWHQLRTGCTLQLFKLEMKQKESTVIPVPPVTVLYIVTIDMSTMQWELWVLGKKVVKNYSNILCNIPHSIQCNSLKELLSILDVSYACPGFPMDTATRILALQDDICRDILYSSTLLCARDYHMLLQQSAGHAKTLCDPCTSFKRKIRAKQVDLQEKI